MSSLTNNIEAIISKAIQEFTSSIIERHEDIQLAELEELWKNVSKNMKISITPNEQAKIASKSKPVKSTVIGGCPYAFSKGEKAKNNEICNEKPKANCKYCFRHAKYEETGQKDKKVLPEIKKTVTPIEKPTEKRVLKMHKEIGKFWHQETGMAFKNAQERVVVGRITNNKFSDLTEEDMDLCRKWGFSFEEKKKDDSDSDDDNEEKPVKASKVVQKISKKHESEDESSDEEDKSIAKPAGVIAKSEPKSIAKSEPKSTAKSEPIPKSTTSLPNSKQVVPSTVKQTDDSDDDRPIKQPAMTGTKKVYLTSGKRYCECVVEGNTFTTIKGKSGNGEKSKAKTFNNNSYALNDMDKVVKEKIAKGYKITEQKLYENIKRETQNSYESDSGDSSDVENIIKGLKRNSLHKTEDEEEDEEENEDSSNIAKKFIANALGLSGKVKVEDENEDEDNLISDE